MSAIEVGVYEAKTTLSSLLQRVEAGEEITITRAGKAVARLVPAWPDKPILGRDRGKIDMTHFDDPLPDDLLEAFGALE